MSNETDLDWLARNVHEWPGGDHQPWCYVSFNGRDFSISKFLAVPGVRTCRIDKADWLARRADLQNKPSWDKAEGWAEWLAQDSYGCWGFFQKKPQIHALSWIARSGYYQIRSPGNLLLGDWRDTLEKRPEEFQPFTGIEDNQDQKMKQDNGWFERGELPPVGSSVTVVEVDGLGLSDLGREFVGEECKVMAVFTRPELSHSDAVDVVVVMEHGGGCCCFVLEMIRPICAERDVLADLIESHGQMSALIVADAIIAAGFKLEAK